MYIDSSFINENRELIGMGLRMMGDRLPRNLIERMLEESQYADRVYVSDEEIRRNRSALNEMLSNPMFARSIPGSMRRDIEAILSGRSSGSAGESGSSGRYRGNDPVVDALNGDREAMRYVEEESRRYAGESRERDVERSCSPRRRCCRCRHCRNHGAAGAVGDVVEGVVRVGFGILGGILGCGRRRW